jgi:hypothetical protein
VVTVQRPGGKTAHVCRKEAEEHLREVQKVLRDVEYCQRVLSLEERFCPWCGNNSQHPHKPECELAAAKGEAP